ncbi:MAG: DUF5518 domain-containing protein [Candidatus Altiarchaeota archaeon]|nr:DUF5518 domain-containing protein [Candidatus Altiarchaeota archaeon]
MVEVKKMLVPALIPGVVAAVFTTVIGLIPVIGMCNLACCLWLMGGGVLAAYLLKKNVSKIELKDGAIVGALSGVVFAILSTIFSAVLLLVGFGTNMATMEQFGGGYMEPAEYGLGILIAIVILFFMYLLMGVVFSAIGGVLGAKLLEK